MSCSHPDLLRTVALTLLGLLLAVGASAGVPNPMRPPEAASSKSPGAPIWKLEAILRSHNRRLAVIDGHLLRMGAVLHGAQILHIGRSSVTLRQGRRIFVLHILPAAAAAFRPLAPGALVR